MGGVRGLADLMTSPVQTTEPAPCEWCGHIHGRLCPYVKAFEFRINESGERQVARVEFLTPADYPANKVSATGATVGEDYPRLGPSRRTPGAEV